MSEHPYSDTPSVYHNGTGSGAARTDAFRTDTLAMPVRFAVYADSEATADIPDEELPTSDAFDPASVLMWGLEDVREACASRCDQGTGHREQFVCESAAGLCELLELAGYGPLRVLYL